MSQQIDLTHQLNQKNNTQQDNNKEKQQSFYKESDHVYLFTLNISKYPKSLQLIICVFGTFLFYIVYGYFQVKFILI